MPAKPPEVVKQAVVDAVLEYYRNPLLFELKCIWKETYVDYPDEWTELFAQHEAPSCHSACPAAPVGRYPHAADCPCCAIEGFCYLCGHPAPSTPAKPLTLFDN